jgi:cytochrome c oxidase cbb3-type subunit III
MPFIARTCPRLVAGCKVAVAEDENRLEPSRARPLSTEDSHSDILPSAGIDASASRLIFLAMLGLMAVGFVAFQMLSKPVGPPPPEVARDALLLQGRAIYLARCVACHGGDGHGDGPLAAALIGPPVGNLTDDEWKHGDRPDQVLAVIGQGVPDTRMDGWSRVLDPPELRAVAAYVYYLAKRPVPETLRQR